MDHAALCVLQGRSSQISQSISPVRSAMLRLLGKEEGLCEAPLHPGNTCTIQGGG
jgi:hypothetical protein